MHSISLDWSWPLLAVARTKQPTLASRLESALVKDAARARASGPVMTKLAAAAAAAAAVVTTRAAVPRRRPHVRGVYHTSGLGGYGRVTQIGAPTRMNLTHHLTSERCEHGFLAHRTTPTDPARTRHRSHSLVDCLRGCMQRFGHVNFEPCNASRGGHVRSM